ncbi:unnamed protein product [Schistosoma guineensis]|nr:unnamed protein product [Schistosoma guineensis]
MNKVDKYYGFYNKLLKSSILSIILCLFQGQNFKIVQGDVLFQFNIIPHNLSNFLRLFSCKHSEVHSIDHRFNNSLDYEKHDKLLSPFLDSCISVKICLLPFSDLWSFNDFTHCKYGVTVDTLSKSNFLGNYTRSNISVVYKDVWPVDILLVIQFKMCCMMNINPRINETYYILSLKDVHPSKQKYYQILKRIHNTTYYITNSSNQNDDLSIHYQVLCNNNFYGNYCEIFCQEQNGIHGYYKCDEQTGNHICQHGWSGKTCTEAICDFGCLHGRCIKPGYCHCDSGWYGKDCSQCRVYPGCLHGGCEVGKRNYSLIPFTCECDHGWGGMLCDKDLRYCSSHLNICNNNGICVNNDANIGVPYQCICPPGFHGDHCEIIDYDCRVHGCNANGECIVHEIGSTTCYCHPGYHGNLCQFNQTTCEEFPCQATGSICKEREMTGVLFPSNGQQFVCICPPGFEGSNCEININECFEKPCKNGGLCKDVVNGYQCVCPSGYNGDNCENQEYNCITKKCPYGYECFTNSTTSLCVSSIPHKSTALHSSNNQTKSGISFEDIQPTYLKFTQFSNGPSIVIFTLLTLFIVIISLLLLKYVLKLNAFRQIAYYNHESDVELNYVRNSMNTRSNFVFNQFKELRNSCYLKSNLYIDHVNKLADIEK